MTIHCVVSGAVFPIPVKPDTRVGQLRMKALVAAQQPVLSSNEWEVRNTDGKELVISNTLAHSDLSDGDKVYIDPRPGVGA